MCDRSGISRSGSSPFAPLIPRASPEARRVGTRARPAGDQRPRRTARTADRHLLASLDGAANALVLQTDLLDRIAIYQFVGDLTQTAYALFSDLIAVARRADAMTASWTAARRASPSSTSRRVLSGPYCTMQLADMGARVIKIEQPGHGDDTRAWGPPFVAGESAYFLSINRNKESVTLDLKHPTSRGDPGRGCSSKADVLVENFRPGTMDRLGARLRAAVAPRYPRLVYCSISGFGQTGPRRDEAGYDAVVQAEGGLMSITGAADGPPYRLGVAISDIVSGMFAVAGHPARAAGARAHRPRAAGRCRHAGRDGRPADLSGGIYFATGRAAGRMGNRHPTIAPYETFEARGRRVRPRGRERRSVAPILCGRSAPASSPRRAVRHESAARSPLRHAAADARGSPADADPMEWVAALKAAGVPCGSVRRVGEVLEDPQLAARGMIREFQHPVAGAIRALGNPVQLSERPAPVQTPPPTLGQHTDQVLREVAGLTDAEISALRSQKAI